MQLKTGEQKIKQLKILILNELNKKANFSCIKVIDPF